MSLLLHTEYSGAEFNEICKKNKIELIKFLNNDLVHFEFKYKEGLNKEKDSVPTKSRDFLVSRFSFEHRIPFSPNRFLKHGMYFYEKSKAHLYWKSYGTKLAFIEIPDNARVYVKRNNFKTDKLIIKNITDFSNIDDDDWISIFKHDYGVLKHIKNQTNEMCILAVQNDGCALQYINNQSEEICILAVQNNPLALRYVKNQTDEICEQAVQKNGYSLRFVNVQTEKICKLAVQQCGDALQFVKKQTKEICLLAVQQFGGALEYVEEQTIQICGIAVQNQGIALKYVNKNFKTIHVCILALQQSHYAEKFIDDQLLSDLYLIG